MEELRQYYYSKRNPALLNAEVLQMFHEVSFELQKQEHILIDFTETPEAVAMDIEEASHRYTDESKKRKKRRHTGAQMSQKVEFERKQGLKQSKMKRLTRLHLNRKCENNP